MRATQSDVQRVNAAHHFHGSERLDPLVEALRFQNFRILEGLNGPPECHFRSAAEVNHDNAPSSGHHQIGGVGDVHTRATDLQWGGKQSAIGRRHASGHEHVARRKTLGATQSCSRGSAGKLLGGKVSINW